MRKPERHALGKAEAEAGRIAMPALALEGDSKSWLAAPWKRSHNAIKKTLKGQHDSLDAEPLSHVYPDSSIVRKTACHGAILGFVMGHDLRRLFVSR
jgi:hypothetical protein